MNLPAILSIYRLIKKRFPNLILWFSCELSERRNPNIFITRTIVANDSYFLSSFSQITFIDILVSNAANPQNRSILLHHVCLTHFLYIYLQRKFVRSKRNLKPSSKLFTKKNKNITGICFNPVQWNIPLTFYYNKRTQFVLLI